jgi:3-hydroxyacyl-CoA dehydrogenase
MEVYRDHPKVTAFLNTTLISLKELGASINHSVKGNLFGFCGLPTFLNRSTMEVSLYRNSDLSILKKNCEQLGTDFIVVDDRVGLVTPRIICMIINEAYYTILEGTATREDIDQAMKLGTNYPFGPFEWAQKIGIANVYETLRSVYEDTKDERYKICAALKKEYLGSTKNG